MLRWTILFSVFPVTIVAVAEHTAAQILARISQMTPFALACNLRHSLKNKEFDAFHSKVTGEPSG